MAFDRHYTMDDLLSRPGERKANGRKTGPDGPVHGHDFGSKAPDDAGGVSGPRAGGRETRQDAKSGQKSTSRLASFLATDDVPPTLFGIPVVQSEADYSEKDLAFFRKHPEAGGYYSMGDGEPQDSKGAGPRQTVFKGGRSMQTAVRKAPAPRISEEAVAAVIPFIKDHEKFAARAYRTKLGVDKKTGAPIYDKWTLGYGQTEIDGRPVRPGDVIDEPSASRYVEQKVRQVADELHRSAGWLGGASAKATAAMYDLAYNMGPGALSTVKSPILHRTASAAKTTRDVDAAIWAQVPTYVRAGGLVLQGLVNRRNDSLELWGPKPEQVAPATAGGTEIRTAGPMPGHREERAGIHGEKTLHI